MNDSKLYDTPYMTPFMKREMYLAAFREGMFGKVSGQGPKRRLSSRSAFELRARWVMGEDFRVLAKRYSIGINPVHRMLYCEGYMGPAETETDYLSDLWAFIDALSWTMMDPKASSIPDAIELESYVRGVRSPKSPILRTPGIILPVTMDRPEPVVLFEFYA